MQITAGNYQGTHDVVYVATESNTVYAIDVHSGTVLLNPNFGTPVSQQSLPGKCTANGPNVGINSTPVIDPSSNTLYVMVYTQGPSRTGLHAARARSGKLDRQSNAASRNRVAYPDRWNDLQLQRDLPAAAPGVVARERQHLCGLWQLLRSCAQSLAGLAAGLDGRLADAISIEPAQRPAASCQEDFFLSSIWMSGYGPATDDAGNVLFVTGNSEAGSYDGVTNIQESVVKMSNTLTTVLDLFTPDNQQTLDQKDGDFGSGGVLVLPDQPGSIPHLAVAAGKDGNMYSDE